MHSDEEHLLAILCPSAHIYQCSCHWMVFHEI